MTLTRREMMAGACAGTAVPARTVAPTEAQKRWMSLGYAMFIHFGPNTLAGVGWGDGRFPARDFHPSRLDTQQWAGVAASAGMKYAILTAKHHDGFCLWNTRHTEYSVRRSGLNRDIARLFVDHFRRAGLKVGFYYSLWDRNFPGYEDDPRYAAFMRSQITELLTNYGEIVELWFDGAWDKDHPSRKWPFDPKWESDPFSGLGHGERWEWAELYKLIHQLQPDCMVLNNSSSDRPGGIRYHPIDARTAEHFDFVWNERVIPPLLDPVWAKADGRQVYLPLEYCTTLTPDWFWKEGGFVLHPSVDTIVSWRRRARAARANLLLNVGPDKDGFIPGYNAGYLKEAARQFSHQELP